jgi:hypothetical protein
MVRSVIVESVKKCTPCIVNDGEGTCAREIFESGIGEIFRGMR